MAGQPDSEPHLLAASYGVSPEVVAEATRFGAIPPMPENPTGSWALVRGRQHVPFVLVQAQTYPAGGTVLHYILTASDVLRAVGGNLKALAALVEAEMPVFEKTPGKLNQLTFDQPEPVSVHEQVDDILDLMGYAHNQIDLIDTLLAAIVQGVPLVVQGAPSDLDTRVKFIQGLLALLPPSARFGVTFSTYTLDATNADTQIRFFGGERVSRQTLVYNWQKGRVGGNEVQDTYSHFITSQLRLDAELVTQRTRELTGVAAWRIRRGEGLAEALGYAAKRFKIDEALSNNQPVEAADVSKVLADDPTLSDDLKRRYVDHLLAFALALEDMRHADPIAVMLRQRPDLEAAIQRQFDEAIQQGKAGLVYDALARWMGNPMGPEGVKWIDLTHRATVAHIEGLVQRRDLAGINAFLEQLHRANPGLELSRIVPRVIEKSLPLAVRDRDLSLTVFLLGVNYLELDTLRRLLSAQQFTANLPPSLGRLAPFITGQDAGLAPSGLLVGTAGDFGPDWNAPVLIRLAEAAIRAGRPDIVDTQALGGLVGLIGSTWATQYREPVRWIAANVSSDEILTRLEPPGPTYVLQLLLASGGYDELSAEMLHQARVLYAGERQSEYVQVIQQVFASTAVPVGNVQALLDALKNAGIRSLPLMMAYVGVLEGNAWASALDGVAAEATKILLETPGIIEVVPSSAMIALLKFHIKRRDVEDTIRIAAHTARVAARDGQKGIALIGRMYKLMDWDPRVQMAGLELMRRFVRQAPDADARRAIGVYGREFGTSVGQALEATYLVRRMLDNVDLLEYAEFLHITAGILHNTATAYVDKNRAPSLGALLNNLESMGGGIGRDERLSLAEDLVELGRTILELGKYWTAARLRDDARYIDELLQNRRSPACAVDMFWIIGGYLTRGKRQTLDLKRILSQHIFGERSAMTVVDEVKITTAVLQSALKAIPGIRKTPLSMDAIQGELDSRWGDIPLEKQRMVVRDLAADFQKVAELVALIAAGGNPKAMEDGGFARKLEEGSQQPKNSIELYRFISGYFRSRA